MPFVELIHVTVEVSCWNVSAFIVVRCQIRLAVVDWLWLVMRLVMMLMMVIVMVVFVVVVVFMVDFVVLVVYIMIVYISMAVIWRWMAVVRSIV